jgi:hypothetical protein
VECIDVTNTEMKIRVPYKGKSLKQLSERQLLKKDPDPK